MEAILYICHGSKGREGRKQTVSFIKECISHNKTEIQEYGFLEWASPSIEEAFERCVSRGASNIKVIPLLLLTAAHAKRDIPEVLSKLNKKSPNITVQYGRPIGVHTKMIEIIAERLYEKCDHIPGTSCVLLAGRGSSDPDVKRDLSTIAEMVRQKIEVHSVVDCYLHGAVPSFSKALQKAVESEAEEIYIIPYLLFTGKLLISMKKTIRGIAKNTTKSIILCDSLGHHPNINWILKERMQELK